MTEKDNQMILHIIFESEGLSKDKIGLHADVKVLRESINGVMLCE